MEWIVPTTSHPVDVAVESEHGWQYFEICVTSFDNVLSHITSCLENQDTVESLTFVVSTKAKSRELKKSIQSNLMFTSYADKIKFDVIGNYMARS